MPKLDELIKVTGGDSQKTLSELVSKVIDENHATFVGITETLVDNFSGGAVEVLRRLVTKIFADKVVHWSRVTVFFILTIFFIDRFNLNLDDVATNLMIEYFPDWMEEHQSTFRWKNGYFYAGLVCAVFFVKLVKTTKLSHFFHSSC